MRTYKVDTVKAEFVIVTYVTKTGSSFLKRKNRTDYADGRTEKDTNSGIQYLCSYMNKINTCSNNLVTSFEYQYRTMILKSKFPSPS